jgi:hypothetical protein
VHIWHGDVLDNVEAARADLVKRVFEQTSTAVERMEAVVDDEVEVRNTDVVPHGRDRLWIELIDIKGPDPIFVEQNVTVDIRPKDLAVRKIVAPSPQRRSGLPIREHASREVRIVRAQATFKDTLNREPTMIKQPRVKVRISTRGKFVGMTRGAHLALVGSILVAELRKQSSLAFLIVNYETIIDIVSRVRSSVIV